MTSTRILGLPLAVLVLHLGFVANESKCRSSHEAGTAGTAVPADHQHHGAGAIWSEPAAEETQAPTVPVCCQALASCSATIALSAGMLALVSTAASPVLPLSAPRVPPSPSAAPEAPPPRV